MALPAPSLANEWQFIQNTEAVTLFRRQAAGGFDGAGTRVGNAFRLVASLVVDPKNVTSLDWLAWQSQTGAPNPKQADVFQDAGGTRWTIRAVDVQAWGQRFLLHTIKEK